MEEVCLERLPTHRTAKASRTPCCCAFLLKRIVVGIPPFPMKRVGLYFAAVMALVLVIQALPAAAQTVRRATYTRSSSSKAAVAKKVTVGGKTYYIVEGNNPALDTGKEACASAGLSCTGYTNLSSNTVCMAAHPGAKQVTGVNGSKNGFYCDGSPQTGLACGSAKNTCMVCPKCNLNANCDTAIGTLYREMYVSCGRALARTSSSRSSVSSRSSSSSSAAGLSCAFAQGGALVRATCNVPGAAGNFCVRALGLANARAVSCAQNGQIVCNVPCNTQGIQNFKRCPTGAVSVTPSGSCPSSSSSVSSASGKVELGGLCKHSGECNDTWGGNQYFVHCVGFSPNSRCSCNMFSQTTSGCVKNLSNLKNQPSGQPCVHGGNCASGMCLGRVCK